VNRTQEISWFNNLKCEDGLSKQDVADCVGSWSGEVVYGQVGCFKS